MNRFLVFAAALCGAAGVALSASAAHSGGGNVATAAQMLLFHAPALLAIGLAGRRPLAMSSLLLLAGLALFCGDLLARHYLGDRLFPYAAPVGGTAMIAGWLAIAAAALIAPSSAAR